jgi:hypothetical protein
MSPAAPLRVSSTATSQLGQALGEAMTNSPRHLPANDHLDDPTRVRRLNGCLDDPAVWTTLFGRPNDSANDLTTDDLTTDDPTTVQATQCSLPEPSNIIVCPLHLCLPSNTGAQTDTPLSSLLAFVDAHAHVPTLMLTSTHTR